ncbi:MAG TPA: hypothetical protein VGZ48_03845 [Candidatus Acidoferrales bacterium]|nr:hypothetical protein [Candidatus Acidoferrales bacterium]
MIEAIEFGEPLRGVRYQRFEKDALIRSTNADDISIEAKLARKPDGLATPIAK